MPTAVTSHGGQDVPGLPEPAVPHPVLRRPDPHADHASAVVHGGITDLRNGNGRCADCNLTKDTPGWATHVQDEKTIVTTTPTGHEHTRRPPQPPTSTRWQSLTPLERRLAVRLDIIWPRTG